MSTLHRFTSFRKMTSLLFILAILFSATGVKASEDKSTDSKPENKNSELALKLDEYLQKGSLAEAEEFLNNELKKTPMKPETQFGLGIIQFFRSFENLARNQYQFGAKTNFFIQMILNSEFSENKSPKEVSYEDVRKIMITFQNDLKKAEETFAKVKTESVKLPIHIALVKFDMDGDGKVDDKEEIWQMLAAVAQGNARLIDLERARKMRAAFDGGDVFWFRGYCQVFLALTDMALAYDWSELFDRCGYLFYSKPKTSYPYLSNTYSKKDDSLFGSFDDLIALVHLVNFPIKEPKRMKSAHSHMLKVIEFSRASWKLYKIETDDEDEWVPNAKQKSSTLGVAVSEENIKGWHEFLNEMEQILNGKKLIPFYHARRTSSKEALIDKKGINAKKIFMQPKRFDLVLWITGTGVYPYVEEGIVSGEGDWNQILRRFGGNFFFNAVWFN